MQRPDYWQQTFARRLSRRSVLRSLAYGAAGLAAAALIGCGTRRQTAATDKGNAATLGPPKLGGDLRTWTLADPYDFDCTYAGQSGPNTQANDLAYESLLGFKYGAETYNTVLQPKLAEKWETPDALNFSFQLRKGVRFANLAPVNGREMTSADWKFSLEYNSRLGPSFSKLPMAFYNWLLAGIDRVDAPDQYTVVVRFKQPYSPFLNYAAGNRLQAMPHEIYDQYGNFHDRIVGTGPFQLDPAASQKGTRWVWKKNPAYWESGKPYLDQITKLVIADNQTAFAAFQTGQLDTLEPLGAPTLSAQDIRIIRSNSPAAVITPYVALPPLNMYINIKRPPLDNVLIRRALSLALDRNEFIDTFSDGKGLLAVPGAFPDTFSQDELKKLAYMKYDPQQAKQLLSQAGYAYGIDFEFLVNKNYGAEHQSEAELIQAQWAKAGIRLKLNVMSDYNEYLKRTREGRGEDYQITMRNKSLETDVDSYLYAIYSPSGGVEGGTAPFDPKLTPLVEGQRKEADAAKRRETVRQACAYIADQCWHLAIFRPVLFGVSQPAVKNLSILWANANDDWARNTWVER